jgi:hypothetical protein
MYYSEIVGGMCACVCACACVHIRLHIHLDMIDGALA